MENKSGAQGNIGLGELTRANPDGYTVGLINIPGHVPHQVVGDAQYDLNEFEYIGVASSEKYMFAASKNRALKI